MRYLLLIFIMCGILSCVTTEEQVKEPRTLPTPFELGPIIETPEKCREGVDC